MTWWLKLRRRRRLHADLSEELAFHREMRNSDSEPPPFGNQTSIRESLFDLWSFHTIETTTRDIVQACRGFRRTPGAAILIVSSLAVGIGAAIAIFTAADQVLFRPLPFAQPDRLVMLSERPLSQADDAHGLVSPDNFLDWQARARSFQSMAVIDDVRTVLRAEDRSEELHLASVTSNFFSLLGVRPAVGEGPETSAASGDALYISHRLWTTWFGSDRAVVGTRVRLDTRPFTVAGVMPAGFGFGDREVDLWTVLTLSPPSGARNARSVRAVGRLAPGTTRAGAQAEMTGIAARLATEDARFNDGWTVALEPLRQAFTRDVRASLLVLLGAVSLLLGVACANAASLLLARNAGRRGEIALRSALGAGRARITRQLLIESLLLTLAAGVAGLGIGWWELGRLVAFAPATLTHATELSIDWRIAAFALAVAALTGVLVGVGPALTATRSVVAGELQRDGIRTTRPGRRTGRLLIASEVAVAVVLLVGSSVLVRSLLRLQAIDPGINPAHLLTFHFRVGSPQEVRLFGESIDRIERLPGVQSASATSFLPFSGPAATTRVTVAGASQPGAAGDAIAAVRTVMPRYFETMGIPIRRGREFAAPDNATEAPLRFVVNDAFVRRYLSSLDDPLDASVTTAMTRNNLPGRIIGVAGDVREGALDQPAVPTVYYPYVRLPYGQMTLIVRTAGDPLALAAPLRAAVHDLDAGVALADVAPMEAILGGTYDRQRFGAVLMASFGLFALLLAAVGVYGTVYVTVSERSREIGIRMALGARPAGIAWTVLWETMRVVAAGLAIGLTAAFVTVRVVAGLLYDMNARDPLAFAVASLLLCAAVLLAAGPPVLRALRVSPMRVLRGD